MMAIVDHTPCSIRSPKRLLSLP